MRFVPCAVGFAGVARGYSRAYSLLDSSKSCSFGAYFSWMFSVGLLSSFSSNIADSSFGNLQSLPPFCTVIDPHSGNVVYGHFVLAVSNIPVFIYQRNRLLFAGWSIWSMRPLLLHVNLHQSFLFDVSKLGFAYFSTRKKHISKCFGKGLASIYIALMNVCTIRFIISPLHYFVANTF